MYNTTLERTSRQKSPDPGASRHVGELRLSTWQRDSRNTESTAKLSRELKKGSLQTALLLWLLHFRALTGLRDGGQEETWSLFVGVPMNHTIGAPPDPKSKPSPLNVAQTPGHGSKVKPRHVKESLDPDPKGRDLEGPQPYSLVLKKP